MKVVFILICVLFHVVTSLQSKKDKKDIPVIYMITPTHTRHTQKADLTRLCHTLMHVNNLHWIVVEDSFEKTLLVTRFLARFVIVVIIKW